MNRKHPRVDVEASNLDDVDTVLVPRPLLVEMSAAIAAMQTLSAENMVKVAKSLGLLARKPRPGPAPLCSHCHLDVALGLAHADGCPSPEAVRHRETDIPLLAD